VFEDKISLESIIANFLYNSTHTPIYEELIQELKIQKSELIFTLHRMKKNGYVNITIIGDGNERVFYCEKTQKLIEEIENPNTKEEIKENTPIKREPRINYDLGLIAEIYNDLDEISEKDFCSLPDETFKIKLKDLFK
jgi:DNA-binding MarR family transcriptional regulator